MDRRRMGKERSMSDNPMFLYAGEYESVEDAKADLQRVAMRMGRMATCSDESLLRRPP